MNKKKEKKKENPNQSPMRILLYPDGIRVRRLDWWFYT